ncbi:MAG: SLC13 family permease [Acidobacteriota bacterium]
MTLQIGLLFLLLAVMVYLFLTEKIPVDLTAFAGLVILVFGGFLEPSEAFVGFSSPAVITMLAVFVVSAGLLQTGVADLIGGRLHKLVGGKEITLIIVVMVVAGVLSAFMNNIAAAAVMMPAVATLARHAKLSPSRLFMPLSFGAILGGTTTLVGTPPNILAGALLEDSGLEPFQLFDYTPLGLCILALGVIYMTTIGKKLLPSRVPVAKEDGAGGQNLSRLYGLEDRLLSIRIPEGSHLSGRSLGETRLGTALGVKVVGIERDGDRSLAPEAASVIRGGDVLVVEGRRSDLEQLFDMQGVEVRATGSAGLPLPEQGVGGIRLSLAKGSPMIGKTLRELNFRQRYGVVVVGLARGGELLRHRLGELPLEVGDALLGLGSRKRLEALDQDDDFVTVEIGFSAVNELEEHVFLLRIPEGSHLVGNTLGQSRLGELVGLTIGGVLRNGKMVLGMLAEEKIEAGDQLITLGEPSRILSLIKLGEVAVESQTPTLSLESETVGVEEVALAPRSSLARHTLRELNFRERYGLQVLALWREGESVHEGMARLRLRLGDALLLQGPRAKIQQLISDPDFVFLSQDVHAPRRTARAPWAIGALALMIVLVATGYQPIQVAAFAAATVTLLCGALTMEEAYRAIEWRAIFLVAAMLPVGTAMERTGAADLMAQSVTEIAGPLGPYAVLASLLLLASVLSQGLDGAPAVVLLTPVVLQASEELGISPYPLMMGISLAASAAFMTPFSHKANLLVMGAGGYRSADYLKVGTPLTIVLLVMLTFLIPLFWAF